MNGNHRHKHLQQSTEDGLSDVQDRVEEIVTSVKENTKYKKPKTPDIKYPGV